MKNVLIVDAPQVFQEFLKKKFSEEKINVTLLHEKQAAVTKMISLLPELMIFDIKETESIDSVIEFLKGIKGDPNASRTPVIALGPAIDTSHLQTFTKLGVSKYFVKPVPFDIFFGAVGGTLKMTFQLDDTPCIMNIHRNGGILVAEIAGGLNIDKLSILRYKLAEIIQENEIATPYIVLILSNVELQFNDGINVEFLIDNVLSCPHVVSKNVKMITTDPFCKDLIAGHKKYECIETSDNITKILNSIVEQNGTAVVEDLIMERILLQSGEQIDGVLDLRFHSDAPTAPEAKKESCGRGLRIALVDNDAVFLDQLSKEFTGEGFACDKYTNGGKFIESISRKDYALIVLDIFISDVSGLGILSHLKKSRQDIPVVVHSRAMNREIIAKALSLGAKRYLVRPQKTKAIVACAKSVLGKKDDVEDAQTDA